MRKKLATVTAHRELIVSSRWAHSELTVSSRWPKWSQPAVTEPWPGPWLSCDLAVTEPWSYWRCRDWAVTSPWLSCDLAVTELWPRREWAVTSPSRDWVICAGSCDLAVTEPWSYWRCRDWAVTSPWLSCDLAVTELWPRREWAVTSPSRDWVAIIGPEAVTSYLHNRMWYTGNMASLYWINPLCGIKVISWHGNTFRITGPLWGESTGYQWIPLTKDE